MIQTLTDALSERGYTALTPVQEAVTDPELQHADLLVSAQTGSGETGGFGLAIAPTLLEEAEVFGPAASPLALVVAPTRELAMQVMRELTWLYAKAGARVVSCVGGMDARDERRALERGAHIVVGTPGRLRDHITRGSLVMEDLRAVVLDEADEMLDLGFREDLEFMLGEAPEDRRTLLFSATVPPMIATLAQSYQRDAVRVTTLTGARQHADITYQALRVAPQDEEHAIINLLRYHDAENAIVFANTRATVARLTARFANRGFAVVSLSGELSQTERTHALQAMRDGRAKVCVAPAVAARGIDLPNLDLVVHAELPSNPETLLHRSGRTGRAGRKGISALVVPPKSAKKAERILKFAKITAEWTTAPTADDILRRDEERLLADPLWAEEVKPDEASFAERLLAERTPEAIAAAYLRLYRARFSAPEELSDPDTPPPVRERRPFGPSTWVSLSVGRDDRAEARWLLPLLCRAGNLDKAAIGAIRVQQSETFVELAEPAVAGFLARLGDGGTLEDGVTAKAVEGTPDFGPRQNFDDRPPRAPKPHRGAPRPDRAPRAEADHAPREHVAPAPAPDARPAPRPERSEAPRRDPAVHDSARPAYKRDKPADRPDKPKGKFDKPKGGFDKSKGPRKTGAGGPKGARDDRAPGGKPSGPGKPYGAGKPSGGKPSGKPWAKPDGAASKGPRKPGKPADSAKPRPSASDTSKRFTPPKGAGKPRAGGTEPPRRSPGKK